MGHDITARGKKTNKEVYLRMSMGEGTLISHFYNALEAEYYNGGVSGNGERKKYSQRQMKKAKEKYLYYKEEYLEPDKRGEEMKEMIMERLFSNQNMIVINNKEEEIGVDFERLDEFFNEAQGEDFIIFFG